MNQQEIFTNNLNRLLSNLSLTQKEVADAIGVSPQTFNTWCQGIAIPRMGKIQKLADYFGVPKSALVDEPDDTLKNSHSTKGVSIPILGSIAAGIPIDAIEDIIGYEDVPLEMAKTGTIYGLRVKGHSMEPRIWEGDIVILRWQADVESGDVAAVLINGEEVTLKKVHKSEQGITLIALNPSVYEPHFYTNREAEELPVTVVGKVLEVRGKL